MNTNKIKHPSFVEGVGVAVVASILGAVLYSVFVLIFSIGIGARLMVAFVFTAYIVYLLWRSPTKRGRMTALLLWGATLFITWFIYPSFIVYLIVHMGAVWLIRSLAFYKSITPALLDSLLVMLSLAVTVWAYLSSHSVLLSLWSLFLVQALFSFLPMQLGRKDESMVGHHDEQFMQAYQNAETAVRKLSSL